MDHFWGRWESLLDETGNPKGFCHLFFGTAHTQLYLCLNIAIVWFYLKKKKSSKVNEKEKGELCW
jgi:hypothetical protein